MTRRLRTSLRRLIAPLVLILLLAVSADARPISVALSKNSPSLSVSSSSGITATDAGGHRHSLGTSPVLRASGKGSVQAGSKVLPTGLPFSEAVRVGNTVYLSGQLGNVPGPGPIKLAPGGMAGEAKQVMDNIQTALQAHGLSMADVVKCTVMLADMSEWGAFNDVYKTYFSGNFPARSAFGSNGLAFNARVEVECIAAWRK